MMRICWSSNHRQSPARITSISMRSLLSTRSMAQSCRRPSSSIKEGTQMDTALTPELRDILNNLATGLFGLDAWVREATKYKPPHQELPWRAPGHVFKPSDLGVIPFFENLLRESSGDDDLGVRWAALTADPLRSSPLPDAKAWRKNRGLTADPKFGIAKSGNVW